MHMPIEDPPETTPPSAERVAQRALVLSAVICRSGIEDDAGNSEAETFRESIISWITRLNLDSEAERDEIALLGTPLGGLSRKSAIESGWKAEGLAVLAWALGSYELPVYDSQVAGPDIAEALGFLEEKSNTILRSPKMRSPKEIEDLGEQLFSLHWRLRQFSIDRLSMDFEAFAKTGYFGPLSLKGITLIDKDLEIRGVAISQADETDWREVLGIVQERHQAVNWLRGQELLYSQVTTDT
jgi:hypothetical protein